MTAAFDTSRPFRLTMESEAGSECAELILAMDSQREPLKLHVHGIDPGGNRTVSADAGDFTVLYRTVLTPQQYLEVVARAEEYNADPEAGWESLRARLAADHLGALHDAAAVPGSPFALLRFDDLGMFTTPPPAATLDHVGRAPSVAHIVTMPLPGALGTTELYRGGDDPSAEVERFNRDPEAGFARLWAAAVTERVERRRVALEEMAAEQVRDLRMVERSVRTGRAVGPG